METDIFKLSKQTGLIDRTWNVAKSAVDYIRIASELAEQSTRLAEFKRTIGDKTDIASTFEGGFAAREVTVDFNRIGAKTKALNAITAFQNVQIQGLDRTVRAFKENPTGLLTKTLAYITVPSILLWYANKDDERVKELPRWQKDLFWIVATDKWVAAEGGEESALPAHLIRDNHGVTEVNKGTIYRLPKPQELGLIFGSLPERVLEKFFTDNPKAMGDLTETISQVLTPSLVPNIAAPGIEHYFNKSLFTGRPIVPASEEGILPEYQYSHYTTETGKALGKMIAAVPGLKRSTAASPDMIENYVRNWTGNLGMYALSVADKALTASGAVADPVKPASTLADIPFVKAFVVRYPSATAQSIQDFNERYEGNKQVQMTIQHLRKQGNYADMRTELGAPENQDKLQNLEGIHQAILNQKRTIQFIYSNPKISPSDKRQAIDGLYYLMIQETKSGNKIFDEMERARK